MKFLMRVTLFAILFGLFYSCDEGKDPVPPDNSFTYDGVKYEINDINLVYEGAYDASFHDGVSENTHHYFLLQFTDGKIIYDCGTPGCTANGTGTDATYFVKVRFATTIADHTEEFPVQSFTGVDPSIALAGNAPADADFYTFFFFRIDEGDQVFNGSDTFVDGSSGTISFAKNGEQYTVTIDAVDTETPGLPIKGSYTGPLKQLP